MAGQGKNGVGIVGARILPEEYKQKVFELVRYLLDKGYKINSGGAMGADLYALEALLALGAIDKGLIFSPWSSLSCFPKAVKPDIEKYLSQKGKISWGLVAPDANCAVVRAGLLARNEKLVKNSSGLVAFLYGESRGTSFTVRRACANGLKVVVFLCDEKAKLPEIQNGRWIKLTCCSPWKGGFLFKQ